MPTKPNCGVPAGGPPHMRRAPYDCMYSSPSCGYRSTAPHAAARVLLLRTTSAVAWLTSLLLRSTPLPLAHLPHASVSYTHLTLPTICSV
eukprot:103956-Prymnesium_polylepis.1